MGKSIRSKSKRKSRTEFRNTIGDAAYKANMAKVQATLKECIETQSMNSFEKIAQALETERVEAEEPMKISVEDSDQTQPNAVSEQSLVKEARGENKVIPASCKTSRRKKNKYRKKNEEREQSEKAAGSAKPSRPKPRFFCQF